MDKQGIPFHFKTNNVFDSISMACARCGAYRFCFAKRWSELSFMPSINDFPGYSVFECLDHRQMMQSVVYFIYYFSFSRVCLRRCIFVFMEPVSSTSLESEHSNAQMRWSSIYLWTSVMAPPEGVVSHKCSLSWGLTWSLWGAGHTCDLMHKLQIFSALESLLTATSTRQDGWVSDWDSASVVAVVLR